MITVEDMKAFEEEVAARFNAGKIPYPVHLEDGNEEELLGVFKDIHEDDWVCCSWRSHLKCLLKGVPEDVLMDRIMHGDSMALCFPEYNIVSSAIVGGILPIAVGIALEIKLRHGSEKVHCFMGDMTFMTGIASECLHYGGGLPVHWICEDNGLSVCTPTSETWPSEDMEYDRYSYRSKWPHAGAGIRVQF